MIAGPVSRRIGRSGAATGTGSDFHFSCEDDDDLALLRPNNFLPKEEDLECVDDADEEVPLSKALPRLLYGEETATEDGG